LVSLPLVGCCISAEFSIRQFSGKPTPIRMFLMRRENDLPIDSIG
jgi:hypothetical protein